MVLRGHLTLHLRVIYCKISSNVKGTGQSDNIGVIAGTIDLEDTAGKPILHGAFDF